MDKKTKLYRAIEEEIIKPEARACESLSKKDTHVFSLLFRIRIKLLIRKVEREEMRLSKQKRSFSYREMLLAVAVMAITMLAAVLIPQICMWLGNLFSSNAGTDSGRLTLTDHLAPHGFCHDNIMIPSVECVINIESKGMRCLTETDIEPALNELSCSNKRNAEIRRLKLLFLGLRDFGSCSMLAATHRRRYLMYRHAKSSVTLMA